MPLEYGASSADVGALKDAEARLGALAQERDALRARRLDLDVRTAALDEMQRQAVIELEQAEKDRRRLSAFIYSKGGAAWQAQALLQTENLMDLQRVNHLGEDFSASLHEAILRAQSVRKRATAETARLALERGGVDERVAQALRVLAASSVAGGAVAGLGIPLDGSPGIAAIADSDGGIWDGDPVWDRAVGPMQFIPETWRRYQVDGDGDGTTDPNNVYDAAYGAGRYLCTAAGHLSDDASLTRAYLAYNHSDSYAAHVLARVPAARDPQDGRLIRVSRDPSACRRRRAGVHRVGAAPSAA